MLCRDQFTNGSRSWTVSRSKVNRYWISIWLRRVNRLCTGYQATFGEACACVIGVSGN